MSSSRDEGLTADLQFNEAGLIPVIAQDAETGEVLMLAWANRQAIDATLQEGEAHYWSRSRQELWRKGGTSGNIQKVERVLIDCDQDALLYVVRQTGPACHTGRRSCFYREVTAKGLASVR
jgi:phosphoribosyl-AMP cyclohydrolase